MFNKKQKEKTESELEKYNEQFDNLLKEITKIEQKKNKQTIRFKDDDLLQTKIYDAKSDHYALIFDNNGDHIATRKYINGETSVEYQGNSYLLDETVTHFTQKPLLAFLGLGKKKKYYFYNLHNTNPLLLKDKFVSSSVISPKMLNIYLKEQLARKLSDTNKNAFIEYLRENPLVAILGLIILGFVAYLMFGA